MKKTILFATLLLFTSISAFAGGIIRSSYDFSADNGEGVTLYYKNCEGGAKLVMPYYDSSSDPSWVTWTEYVYTDPIITVPEMAGGLTVVAIDNNALYNSHRPSKPSTCRTPLSPSVVGRLPVIVHSPVSIYRHR